MQVRKFGKLIQVQLDGKFVIFSPGGFCDQHPRKRLWTSQTGRWVHWYCEAGHLACTHPGAADHAV